VTGVWSWTDGKVFFLQLALQDFPGGFADFRLAAIRTEAEEDVALVLADALAAGDFLKLLFLLHSPPPLLFLFMGRGSGRTHSLEYAARTSMTRSEPRTLRENLHGIQDPDRDRHGDSTVGGAVQ